MAQVVADALSLSLDQIKISATRTDKVPNTSATAASSGADLQRDGCFKCCEHTQAATLRIRE